MRKVQAHALVVVLFVATACASKRTQIADSDAGGTPDSGVSADAGLTDAGGGTDGATPPDSGPVDGAAPRAVTCSAPSTAYKQNGGACGTDEWAVKTGTDSDVGKINLVPQEVTIPDLIALPTAASTQCNRAPTSLNTYLLRDVNIKFEALEADSDYHLIATDPHTGKTMVTEVPFPGCLGHDRCQTATPLLCAITHARAAVDAVDPTTAYGSLGPATIIGVGFFDTYELGMPPGPAGEAPNGVEIHPILAICFGLGCDPLAGY